VVVVGVLRMVPTSCVVWFESVWILIIQEKSGGQRGGGGSAANGADLLCGVV